MNGLIKDPQVTRQAILDGSTTLSIGQQFVAMLCCGASLAEGEAYAERVDNMDAALKALRAGDPVLAVITSYQTPRFSGGCCGPPTVPEYVVYIGVKNDEGGIWSQWSDTEEEKHLLGLPVLQWLKIGDPADFISSGEARLGQDLTEGGFVFGTALVDQCIEVGCTWLEIENLLLRSLYSLRVEQIRPAFHTVGVEIPPTVILDLYQKKIVDGLIGSYRELLEREKAIAAERAEIERRAGRLGVNLDERLAAASS